MSNVLKYKASFNIKIKCACITMSSLVMSPLSRDFLKCKYLH